MCSLYIHIPFCDRKCFYCSFAIVVGQLKQADDYVQCLFTEAGMYESRVIDSVYVGGGTPTAMTPHQLSQLFVLLRKRFVLREGCEVTVEANPEGLSREKLEVLRECGVNRISLGVQTLRDDYLKYLGRLHDARAAAAAFELIRSCGFDNVSCDLMISFPDQSEAELREDQERILTWNPEHISLYSLTIEAPSRFFAQKVQPPPDELQARQLSLTVSTMAKHGYLRYEVSNFALPGYESAHNINYWSCGDYIGLGMGAHSHVQGERYNNVDRFAEYLRRIQEGESPRQDSERLTKEQRLVEAVLLGLRMTAGVNLAELEQRFDSRLDDGRRTRLAAYIKEGLLKDKSGRIWAPPAGMMVLDEISASLF
ncbi:MAG: radical SAM family heme chaperone HemW [Candidatus Omnitrophica bacterium]|nr:radical SAM family heme chaperone HemW [Candidatus Omnitrophota bacterium]